MIDPPEVSHSSVKRFLCPRHRSHGPQYRLLAKFHIQSRIDFVLLCVIVPTRNQDRVSTFQG